MDKDFCCHGNCEQSDTCPRRRVETPGDTRLGLALVIAGSGLAWVAFFYLLSWARS